MLLFITKRILSKSDLLSKAAKGKAMIDIDEKSLIPALEAVPRQQFVAETSREAYISGHSLPTQLALQRILNLIPLPGADRAVLHVGGGTGYIAAVLAQLFRHVFVLEKQAPLAANIKNRLSSLEIRNVQVIEGDATKEQTVIEPCSLILCTCILSDYASLLPWLTDNGYLVALEDEQQALSSLVLYRKQQQTLVRQSNLGWVDFSRRLEDSIIDLGLADEQLIREASIDAKKNKKPLMQVLSKKLNLDDLKVFQTLAQERHLVFKGFDDLVGIIDSQLFKQFSRTYLDRNRVLPLQYDQQKLILLTDNPDIQPDEIAGMNGLGGIECILVTPNDFKRLWAHLDVSMRSNAKIASQTEQPEYAETKPDVINPYLVALYDAILLEAVSENASDIHLEFYNNAARVRLRVDGDLHDIPHFQFNASEVAGLVNIIKIRAELNIAERRLPQGGRSQLKHAGNTYDLRVQTQPALHAEHVVIRLLKHTGRALTMQELGMSTNVAALYHRLLANPAGLVLVVGPTGSGKSTTLYAGLQELADDGTRKVITAEDPIEYSIDKIQQTRIRSDIGFDFPDALRAFVREDPDVILVGEIRDHPTALEAIRASQTGHLVLSTLHCNDAVDALQRLYDLNIHPNSLASELLAVIAQRLAKRICPHCKVEVSPDPQILQELFPQGAPGNFRCYAGKGCQHCHERGTKGRTAVVEFMHVNADIRNAISRQPSITEIRWQALDAGLITMRDSALDLVVNGIIPLSELPKILPQDRMAPESRGGRRN